MTNDERRWLRDYEIEAASHYGGGTFVDILEALSRARSLLAEIPKDVLRRSCGKLFMESVRDCLEGLPREP